MNRQGPDFGTQYRSAIFYFDEDQRNIASETINFLISQGIDVLTEILPATQFFPAEEYHQQYFKKNPERLHSTCHIRSRISWE
ncbi:MAG: peptide-methionine (S)-S-oxide reductase [Synergistaceae bacterium]|nr:peptide-methionine (S)-S-oxide reductase [Synergistaceae bacterium]